MKKILLAISALSAALFSTAANADISVSGSANAVYVDSGGNSQAHVGGTISFSMSTTTDGGVTISTSGQITSDQLKSDQIRSNDIASHQISPDRIGSH